MSTSVKPRPLSPFALAALQGMTAKPVPAGQINQGIRVRLANDGLICEVYLPSPYPTYKGSIRHFSITDKGRQVLEAKAQ